MPRLARVAPALLALLSLLLVARRSAASLSRLREYQRECFVPVQACFMFMDEDQAYGCQQCGDDIRQELVREFAQREDLVRFLESDNDRRIIMVPDFLFFLRSVLNALAATKNVAAVVVYEPTPEASPIPFPPLQDPQLSTDLSEPNFKYNFNPQSSVSPPLMRNSVGNSRKYDLYPFNIFRVNSTTAEIIRQRAKRFPGQDENLLASNGGNRSSSTSPRYKLQSMGQMFACPSNTASPTATAGADGDGADEDPEPAIMTSAQCLKDRTCMPIGGQSVWSALGWVNASIPNTERRILAITAPMDSNAFFADTALGASAEITSLAVLMAVAQAVGEYRRGPGKDQEMNVQPVYFAWNAESWGYAGSARFLKDVNEFNCTRPTEGLTSGCQAPYMESLKFLDLRGASFTVLNIGQLTAPNVNGAAPDLKFFLQGARVNKTVAMEIENILLKNFNDGSNPDLTLEAGNSNLVPIDASQSFHRFLPDSDIISVTSYKREFENVLYHSIYDNVTLIKDQASIVAAANAIANTVVEFCFEGDQQTVPPVSREVIMDVVDCLSNKWEECNLAKEYLGGFFPRDKDGNPSPVSPGNYPGSYYPPGHLSSINPSGAAKLSFIRSFLAYHNRYEGGDVKCQVFKDCKNFTDQLNATVKPSSKSELRITFCANSTCVASDTYTHNAYGTALNATNAEQSEFKYVNRTEQEGNASLLPLEAGWTESFWDSDLGLCGFVEDTALFGGLILGSGIAVLLLSAAVTFWFDRMMFPKSPPEAEESQRLIPGEVSV